MGATMSPQIEVGKRVAGESGSPSDARLKGATHVRWLILAIALIITTALLASGLWSRLKARRQFGVETSPVAVTAVTVGSAKQTTHAQETSLAGHAQPL